LLESATSDVKVPEGEMKNVSRIFNLAKQDISGPCVDVQKEPGSGH
jgi:hypothetical protein